MKNLIGTYVIATTLFPILTWGALSVPNSISLSGSDWKIHEDPSSQGVERQFFNADLTGAGWIGAQVPGNIQADLEAAHLVAPLWYGAVNTNLYEVARKDWWYRKDFVVPASFQAKRITLDFDGVDDTCKVWLNGKLLGENGGMFRRFWFDVSGGALPGRTNHLAVQVNRMPETLVPLLKTSDGPNSGEGTTNWFVYGMAKTINALKDLKTPGVWSYDWSADVWTLGIWKDVRLTATGPVRIDWTRVETTLNSNYTRATVHTTLEIDSPSARPVQAQFVITGQGHRVTKQLNAALTNGLNLIKADLLLDQPALWWPNGQGEQPLYLLNAELQLAEGGAMSDRCSTRFGVRELRWGVADASPVTNCYQLFVNGRAVRAIGTALVLPYILPGCGQAHELQLLHFARNGGMNFLRLNGGGGGPLFDELWYNLADELGIMIQYEYPLANTVLDSDPMLPNLPAILTNLDATCRNMVKQSRNHPSIVEYVGGSEVAWSSRTPRPQAVKLMQKIVEEESDRLFRVTDPDDGGRHSPWDFELMITNHYHHYNSSQSDTPWYGEFGAVSAANLEIWQREIPLQSQWPLDIVNDPSLMYHNAIFALTSETWLYKTRIDRVFGCPDNLPDFIKGAQYIGAEGLRYAFDGLRRKGKRIGGITSHDFSEPWPNAAGSYLVDYDGRPLMNYDFLKQALAPLSLSLQMESCLYKPESGIQAELFLVSDAPKQVAGLRPRWIARDREGTVFDQGSLVASIAPLEVKSLGTLRLRPPQQTSEGPVFVELRLEDSAGKLLVERVQVLCQADLPSPFAGLLNNRVNEALDISDGPPNGPNNLAFIGNGAKPATASSALPDPKHQPQGINDGIYGNAHSWIGLAPRSWFQIDLGKPLTLGQFKLGRDRTGELLDRQVDYLKVETSLDGRTWQTVFEQSGLTVLKSYSPQKSMLVSVTPVQARFVKATVGNPKEPGETACVDEFEVYAPSKGSLVGQPQVRFIGARSKVYAVRRTTLQVTTAPMRKERDQEVLELRVKNTGRMTALFCEPHPLLVYRTDLFIDNNNCFIPPGESRLICIRASSRPECGLSLAQTGWTLSTWNADDVTVAPSADVLLSVGRWDKMCREFAGYFDVNQMSNSLGTVCTGNRADAGKLPYRLSGTGTAQFEFDCSGARAHHPARLRIHTSDQSETTPTVVAITLNGRTMEKALRPGLGIQRTDPAHRAYPATVEFDLAGSELCQKSNTLTVSIAGDGWFAWDALELVTKP